jgi:phosphomannomutase
MEDLDPADIVSLRVRTETGKRNVIIRLPGSEPISKVYAYVRPYLEGGKNTKFELRTNFPAKAYPENDPKSLKDHGLAPSSALITKAT